MPLPPVRFSLEEIIVDGQYGKSFKAISLSGASGGSEKFGLFQPEQDLLLNKGIVADQPYFIKIPGEELTDPEQREFVFREFDNASAINHVANRRFEWAKEKGKTPVFVTVSKMIGVGRLTRRLGGVELPNWCLVYEFAGPREGGSSLAAKGDRSFPRFAGTAVHFLRFALGLCHAVRGLHNQGIEHSFLVPRNIIWEPNIENSEDDDERSTLEGRFTIVGFGFARHANAVARSQATTKTAGRITISEGDRWYRAPECSEEPDGVFGYQADIYSIGALLYGVLVGLEGGDVSLLKRPQKDDQLLKQSIAVALHTQRVVRENENILKIIDSCLRFEPSSRYSCVEELIEAIEIAKDALPHEGMVSPDLSIREDSYFDILGKSLDAELKHRRKTLAAGHFEVYGHRDKIVASLCRLIGSNWAKKQRYHTMTLPDYWTDENLGSTGRFLTMNKHMVRHGLHIYRLFLVAEDFHLLPEVEQQILERQRDARKELDDNRNSLDESLQENYGTFELMVLKRTRTEIADFERNGELVAFLSEFDILSSAGNSENMKQASISGETVCLNFFSTARKHWQNGEYTVQRLIKKVRYWTPVKVSRSKQFEKSLLEYRKHWINAQTLEEFMSPSPTDRDGMSLSLPVLIGAPARKPST